jgi:hypothetical protein
MGDPLTAKTVTDFVLESEANFTIAVKISEVFPQIKRQIVVPILEDLEARLKKSLGSGLEIWNMKNEIFVKSWPSFGFFRPSWKDRFSIELQSGNSGESTFVGVGRDRNLAKNTVCDDALLQAFRKRKMGGAANRGWAWHTQLPEKFGKWNGSEALSAMHFRSAEFVNYLEKQIIAVYRIAAPIIDNAVGQK